MSDYEKYLPKGELIKDFLAFLNVHGITAKGWSEDDIAEGLANSVYLYVEKVLRIQQRPLPELREALDSLLAHTISECSEKTYVNIKPHVDEFLSIFVSAIQPYIERAVKKERERIFKRITEGFNVPKINLNDEPDVGGGRSSFVK